MAVLLQLANGQGKCDARCYGAEHERCSCRVCGGVLHGIGQDRALTERTRLLKLLDQEEAVGEVEPHRVDTVKRRQRQSVVILERRVATGIIRKLRAPARVRAQVAAGQLPLWHGADRPAPILPLARPRRRD